MRKNLRPLLLAATTAAFAVLSTAPADARPGGTTTTRTSTLNTIGVAATASDNSVCSQVYVNGLQMWQCTPVLVASASVFHPVAQTNLGGSLNWTGYATCEYRKRADGVTNDWTAWTSCNPTAKGDTYYRSWGVGAAPSGGSITFTWPRIENFETSFVTDCVEIRTSISSNATARGAAETVSAYARYPSSGSNLSGICEGGSAY